MCRKTKDYRFGFNGKYKDNEIAGVGNSLDFGARMYNSRIGRWMAVDPLAAKYPSISPYAFAANTPIQAKDPDGEKVLFVNGYYNTGLLSPVAGSHGGEDYWGSGFIRRAKQYFNDNNAQFIDGRGKWNSTGKERFNAGYEYAKQNYSSLIEGVVDKDGVQIQTFKVLTHSMGGAYGEGIIKYLEDQGLKVEKVVHLSMADASGLHAWASHKTIQLNYEKDVVLSYKNFGEGDRMTGTDLFGIVKTPERTKDDLASSHARTKFDMSTFDALKDLENLHLEGMGGNKYKATGNEKNTQFNTIIYQDGKNVSRFDIYDSYDKRQNQDNVYSGTMSH